MTVLTIEEMHRIENEQIRAEAIARRVKAKADLAAYIAAKFSKE